MTETQTAAVSSTNELRERSKQQKSLQPVEAGDNPGRNLVHVGNTARQVLQDAKMPRHWWAIGDAWELVLAALGQYAKERKRVLAQRQQLRQLHAKVLQLKGGLLSKEEVITKLAKTIESQRALIEEMKRNR